jgi:hypothetical protein
MMTYKVVPFTALVHGRGGDTAAASQLEDLITAHAREGWDYVRLEHADTVIAGNSGCFGFGATPAQSTSIAMAVFRR